MTIKIKSNHSSVIITVIINPITTYIYDHGTTCAMTLNLVLTLSSDHKDNFYITSGTCGLCNIYFHYLSLKCCRKLGLASSCRPQEA